MPSKIRKQIYLEPRQNTLLKQIARQTGASEAEVIRQAIDLHIGSATSSPRLNLMAWEQEKLFIQRQRKRKSTANKRNWTREELHEQSVS